MAATEHQEEKKSEVMTLIKTEPIVVLKGSAGVGKTWLVNDIIKSLPYGKVICAAPTNKALAVLRSKIDDRGNVEFMTAHQAMKMRMKYDKESGRKIFMPVFSERYPPLKGVRYLIVDEASMIGKDMKKYLELHSKQQRTTIIFIGDDKQINPVKEEDSPVFLGKEFKFPTIDDAKTASMQYDGPVTIKPDEKGAILYVEYPTVELTEIVRQGAGNPIIELSRNLPEVKSRVDNRIDDKGYIFTNDRASIINTLSLVNGTDELKYVAWDNDDVDKVNKDVRQLLYGHPKKVEQGETLIFNSPYKDSYHTNEEILVETLDEITKEFVYVSNKSGVIDAGVGEEPYYGKIELTCYSINAYGEDEGVLVVHEKDEKRFKALMTGLNRKAKYREIDWPDYGKFEAQFADITYNHAITIHKSQGSTYKQTIVNLTSVMRNRLTKERDRLLYTAITRTSDLLILYNSK